MGMKGEERDAFIAQCCDAFKRALLARASKVPYNWDCPEIRQWVIDTAREMQVPEMRAERLRKYRIARQIHGL